MAHCFSLRFPSADLPPTGGIGMGLSSRHSIIEDLVKRSCANEQQLRGHLFQFTLQVG